MENLVTANGFNGSNNTYTYDADGNLLTSSTVTGGTTTQGCNTYSTVDQNTASYPSLNTSTYACTGTPTTLTYDGAGNETGTNNGLVESYTAGDNAATTLEHSMTPAVTYGYADAGNSQRVSASWTPSGNSSPATAGYVNGPLGVTARKIANLTGYMGTTYYTRDPQGSLIDEHGGPAGINYYESDQEGSVLAVSTAAGVATGTYTYTPLGNIGETNVTGHDATDNPFTYTGAYFDDIEGDTFVHLGTRYYMRNTNFTQMDGQPSEVTSPALGNLYSYTGGDPVNSVDPTGQFSLSGLVSDVGDAADDVDTALSVSDAVFGSVSDGLDEVAGLASGLVVDTVCNFALGLADPESGGLATVLGEDGCTAGAAATSGYVTARLK
jgi:RHS repeat-associated protein